MPVPAILQNYKPVTAERLLKPEDSDVLMIRRTYDGWGYSPLKQITTSNVGPPAAGVVVLRPAPSSGHEATPLVNNGVMFVSTPGNQVLAIDAKTGHAAVALPQPGAARRDPAASDQPRRGAVRATRCSSRVPKRCWSRSTPEPARKLWSTTVEDNTQGLLHVARAARCRRQGDGRRVRRRARRPRIRRGVRSRRPASSCGRSSPCRRRANRAARPGRRAATSGRPAAARSGSPATTTPRRSWRSSAPATAVRGWAISGRATTCIPPRRSPSTSTTGTIKGHHQYNPNESWDWDEVSPPILVDYQRNGRTVKGLIDVARDGYLWFLERTDGPIKFVDGDAVRQAERLPQHRSARPGRPDVDPDRKPGTGKRAEFCPSFWGGKNWPPIAFNPDTRMIYIPANENLCSAIIGREVPYSPGTSFVGATSTLMHRRQCRPHRRSAGVERGHREAGLDAHLRRPRPTGARC